MCSSDLSMMLINLFPCFMLVTSPCDDLPIYDEFDDCHVESISCDAMLHRISCDNSLGHIMFDNPLDLSYAMNEINHM